jgi:multidrug efflux pump subunit AcrA (membrane-fusion protein)
VTSKFTKLFLPLLAIVMLVFSVWHVMRAQQTAPKPPPPIEPPRTPFSQTVAGAGIVEAETENIAIGSALPGVVLEVYVPVEKVGQRVKAGDKLFLVDTRALEALLKFQEANLASANAQLELNEASLRLAKATNERFKTLFKGNSGAVSELQLDQYQAQEDQAVANINLSRAAIQQAEAQIGQTKTDIGRCLVRAPVDGKVLQVNLRPGEYVGTPPSQALLLLGSVHNLNVRVDIDENDIPRAYPYFRPGVPAFASPRGDPSKRFPMRFVRVEPYVIPKQSLTGDNTERVDTRVLQVIYQVDRDEPGLFVGMQVDVFLDTSGDVDTAPTDSPAIPTTPPEGAAQPSQAKLAPSSVKGVVPPAKKRNHPLPQGNGGAR